MNWTSWDEFWRMGGYGLYVWGAYAVTAVLIAAELVILSRRGRTLRVASGRSAGSDNRTQ